VKFLDDFRRLNGPQRHTFLAALLGWTMDALDYFILIFCVPAIAHDFHTKASVLMGAVFFTQFFRPLGALCFGLLAERFGRRPVLMINILSFTLIELACAFAPSLTILMMLRALFGFAMGGEWGTGAALTFESLPAEGRGSFSGILQQGYALGSILASGLFAACFRWVGWRGLFVLGALPALLVLYVRMHVPESPVWLAKEARRKAGKGEEIAQERASIRGFIPEFFFLLLLMTAFMSFSHGTQDLYPTFLSLGAHLRPEVVGSIGVIYGVGSIFGGTFFGYLSERWGRKRAIVAASLLALPVIPLYAYGNSALWLGTGAFLMQFMVQGAWGVVPAYLTELTPAPIRATATGLVYQLGGLITAWNGRGQALAAEHFGNYRAVLAITVAIVAGSLAILASLGREARGRSMDAAEL